MSLTISPPDIDTPVTPLPEERPDEAEVLRAWGREMDWLDVQWSIGTFAEYVGEYIITAEHVLLAHSRDLHEAYLAAERKADELGIPHWKLVNYFC